MVTGSGERRRGIGSGIGWRRLHRQAALLANGSAGNRRMESSLASWGARGALFCKVVAELPRRRELDGPSTRQSDNQTFHFSNQSILSLPMHAVLVSLYVGLVLLWVIIRLVRRASGGSVSLSVVRVLRVFAVDSYELRYEAITLQTSRSRCPIKHVCGTALRLDVFLSIPDFLFDESLFH